MKLYLKTLCSIVLITLCTPSLPTSNSRLDQEQLDQEMIDANDNDQDQNTDTAIDKTDILILTGIIGSATLTATYFCLKQYYGIDLINLLEKTKKPDPSKPENPSSGHK